MKKLIFILLLITTTIWANDDTTCNIGVRGKIAEVKNSANSYITIQGNDTPEQYLLVKDLSNYTCNGISKSEILNSGIIINNYRKLKKDHDYDIDAQLSPRDGKVGLVFTADWIKDYNEFEVKMKKGEKNTEVKFLIKSAMLKASEVERDTFLTQTYGYAKLITHISAKVNNQTVFDVTPTSNIAKNTIFKFKFKNIENADKIVFLTTDNEGRQRKIEFKIAERLSNITDSIQLPETHFFKTGNSNINPKVFETTTVDKAIQELYGSIESPIENKIYIEIPETVGSCGGFSANVLSDVELESLAVFSNKIQKSAIAVFSIPPVAIIDYIFKIKSKEQDEKMGYSITVIGKGKDGKFYKAVKEGRIVHSCE